MSVRVERLAENVMLYCGDAVEIIPQTGRHDVVLTDPPYAIPTQVAQTRTITRNVGDLSIVEGAFREHVALWKSCVGETGRIFVFCDGASYPVMYRAAYGSFNLASLVWDKQKIGMGREFRKRHEFILHGWGAQTAVMAADGTGYPDVICCKPVPRASRLHPAQKPVELLGDLLRVCGQRVLDPFMGSASTGIASIGAGKAFTGIEIHEPYFDTACRRLEAELRRPRLFAEPAQVYAQEALAI